MSRGILARFFGGGQPPHPLFAELQEYFLRLDHGGPIGGYEFVVLDTELTGLDKQNDEIIAIGGVRIRNLRIVVGETFHSLVQPRHYPAGGHTHIHRITPQQLAGAPRIEAVLPEFIAFCGRALLVGHGVGLDMGFLNRVARPLYGAEIANPCMDTLRLAQVYTERDWHQHQGGVAHERYDLGTLRDRYNLPPFILHDALQDALQTAYLFLFLVKKLERLGCASLRDFSTFGQGWKLFR